MIRRLVVIVFIALMPACTGETVAPSGEVVSEDPRYDLALFGLPRLSYGTAKTCYQVAKIGEGEMKKTPGVMGELFGDHMVPFWRHVVGSGSNSKTGKGVVLSYGEFSSTSPPSDFVLPSKLIQRARECGRISGEAFVASAFLNINQIVEIEATEEGANFDGQQSAGVYIMGQAAIDIAPQDIETILDCVATLRATFKYGENISPDYLIWNSLLADFVGTGKINQNSFGERSSEFKKLLAAKGEPDILIGQIDKNKQSKCLEVTGAALERARVEFAQ